MHIRIDPSSGVPIYQQIAGEFKMLIAGGMLSPGDRLPSVRQLAIDLRVNPNTVAKAYNEMERDGITVTRRGEGTFVSEKQEDLPRTQGEEILKEQAMELVGLARKFEVAFDRLLEIIQEVWQKSRKKEDQ